MVSIPPPNWMFLFLALAGIASAELPWKQIAQLRVVPLGIALAVLGFALTLSALALFRAEGTEINPTSETNKKLLIAGPYRFTRNPMYLGLVIFSLGIAFWIGTPPMFAVPVLVFAVANWVHIPFEEQKMRRQFGSGFDDYAGKVRRWV